MLQLYQGLDLVANRHFGQPSRPRPCVQAAAGKKQKPKKRKAKKPLSQRISYEDDVFDGDMDGEGPADIRLVATTHVPKAPEPKAGSTSAVIEPEDLYPVFPKQPKRVEKLLAAGSKWSWGDDSEASEPGQQNPPERLWNPRTGFMRTRAELEQEQAAANAKSVSMPQQPAGNSSNTDVVERLPVVANPLQPPSPPWTAAAGGQTPEQLPSVGRGQVLLSCTVTAGAMTAAALGLSLLATKQSAVLFGTNQADVEHLLQLPAGLQTAQQAGVMLAAAALVTAARLLLKEQWLDFREASDRSNQQVLSSLSWPDVAVVALLSGVSEELLFRWALVAGTWPDVRGVLLSGAVFGALHVSGGRNAAFAAWAAAVGWLYGGVLLATGNVWVPAGAHALANFASAAVWMTSNPQTKQTTQ